MGWSVVVVDIQLSIHIENLYYIVNRGRGYTTIYTHREPVLHSQWGGASWSWIYNYLYTLRTYITYITTSQWGGASWSWIYNYLYTLRTCIT